MTKIMIFDLDGTLLDTIHDLAAATNYVLEKYGYPTHPTKDYCYKVGNGVQKLVSRALPQEARAPERVERLAKEQVAYYNEHMLDQTAPFPGIPDVLRRLRERGIQLAVLTNKPDAPAQGLMRDFFPDVDFIQVMGNKDGMPHKPDPTALNRILEETGFSKDEALYVGDSDVDMQVARNAGVKGIGVLWGYRTKEELEQAGAFALLDKVEQLLDIPEK